MKKIFAAAMMSVAVVSARAELGLNPMVSDNMVLQQNASARVWGTATPGGKVEVRPSWGNEAVVVMADNDGRWEARLSTPAGSFDDYSVTFTDKTDGDTVTVGNLLVGEVWLASGQSNMQMPLKGYEPCPVNGGFDEVAQAGRYADAIRFLTVPLTQSHTPVDTVAATWVVPSARTATEFSAVAWHFAKRLTDVLNVPVGIVSAAYGGAKVESWLPEKIVKNYPDINLDRDSIEGMVHYLRPVLMYNAMFTPVKDYTYKGIIWYQGCSNVDSWQTYAGRLASMVGHWREEIGEGEIPFYAVEIAPFDYGNDQSPYLREAQWDAVAVIPNSGMVATNDMAQPHERHNIHPAEKRTIGDRLGNLALNRTYGYDVFPVDAPRFKSLTPEGNRIRVTFDTPRDGLCRNHDITGFEIAGRDKVFHPANVVEINDQQAYLVLSSPEVAEPLHVRYCFHDFQLGNMCGADFLPLVPFRSDR